MAKKGVVWAIKKYTCIECGVEFESRGFHVKRCPACAKKKKTERAVEYNRWKYRKLSLIGENQKLHKELQETRREILGEESP